MSYHNTTSLSGPALADAQDKARSQDEMILEYFRTRWTAEHGRPGMGGKRGASDAITYFHGVIKESSVRRGISNLARAGSLEKLEEKQDSPNGRPEHLHIYKPGAGEAFRDGQIEMF
jgi:hypothetical protein